MSPRKTFLSTDDNYIAYLANDADIYVFLFKVSFKKILKYFLFFKTMDHVHTYRGAEKIVDFCFSPINREQIVALTGRKILFDIFYKVDYS